MEWAALAISFLALILGLINAAVSAVQRSREGDAAVTGDMYPVLRALRDSAWQYAKPLGGQGNDDLVAMHYALIDLHDLQPAIRNKELRERVEALLTHDAARLALSIDPPRFMGAMFGDEALGWVHDFAVEAESAVQRCQALRRGAS